MKCNSCGNYLKPHTMSKVSEEMVQCKYCENIMDVDSENLIKQQAKLHSETFGFSDEAKFLIEKTFIASIKWYIEHRKIEVDEITKLQHQLTQAIEALEKINNKIKKLTRQLEKCKVALTEIAEDEEESSYERAENALWAAKSALKAIAQIAEGGEK